MTPAYAAGLFDGEGCIYISASKRTDTFYPVASVGMSDRAKPILEELKASYGGAVRLFREETEKWAAAYVWRVDGKTATTFLETILPHLELKKEQARLAILLQTIIGELPQRTSNSKKWDKETRNRARAIWERIKELNRKGPSQSITEPPIPGAKLFALRVGGQWVKPERDLLSDLGWAPLSGGWPSAGIMRPTACWTLSISEYPSEEDGYSPSSLKDILQPDAAPKYSLSPKAATGILRRAAKRGRELPPQLEAALTALASTLPAEGEKTTRT